MITFAQHCIIFQCFTRVVQNFLLILLYPGLGTPNNLLRNLEMSVLSSSLQEATLGLSLSTIPTPVSPLRANSTNEAPELTTPADEEEEEGSLWSETERGSGTKGRSSPVMERRVVRSAE